jgi:hypothetical protein
LESLLYYAGIFTFIELKSKNKTMGLFHPVAWENVCFLLHLRMGWIRIYFHVSNVILDGNV